MAGQRERLNHCRADVVVIGGGIYGCMAHLAASQAGMRSLLLEQGDFGHATSMNSLRIAHGGLRYLQSLDLARFFESVSARRWLLEAFPNQVTPMRCMMPLTGRGLHRPMVFRAALALNSLLSRYGNPVGAPLTDQQVNTGTHCLPSAIKPKGYVGAASWYDASINSPQRLVIDSLRWARELGGEAFNYIKVQRVVGEREVEAVEAYDRVLGETVRVSCRYVFNCTGPWLSELPGLSELSDANANARSLFEPSLAANILFDRPAISDHACALQAPSGQMLFVRAWRGKLLAGTVHEPLSSRQCARTMPSMSWTSAFFEALNTVLALPEPLSQSDIARVYWGYLPVEEAASTHLSKRDCITSHADNGGFNNVYSVSGAKFTTAPIAAIRLVKRASGHNLKLHEMQPPKHMTSVPVLGADDVAAATPSSVDACRHILHTESVYSPKDFLLRRTHIGDHPDDFSRLSDTVLHAWNLSPSRLAAFVTLRQQGLGNGADYDDALS